VVRAGRLAGANGSDDDKVGVGFCLLVRHWSRWEFIKASFMRWGQTGQGTRPSSGRWVSAFSSHRLYERGHTWWRRQATDIITVAVFAIFTHKFSLPLGL